MVFYGLTDVGKVRSNNQDSFRACKLENGAVSAVVCDGMGGAAGGSLASETACDAFCELISQNSKLFFDAEGNLKEKVVRNALLTAVNKANTAVYKKALMDNSLSGMGTTLTACFVYKNVFMSVNVGDSRTYAIYSDHAERVSKDHSYVQALVDEGEITEEQAQHHPKKNIILRAVGIDDSVEVDFFTRPADMDYILLCSDGLSNYIPDSELHKFFTASDIKGKTVDLVDFANLSGGGDNITAVVIDLKDGEGAEA